MVTKVTIITILIVSVVTLTAFPFVPTYYGLAAAAVGGTATPIIIWADKDSYDKNETVTISGKVDTVDGNQITLEIREVDYQDFPVIISFEFQPNQDGTFERSFSTDSLPKPGPYNVKAVYGNWEPDTQTAFTYTGVLGAPPITVSTDRTTYSDGDTIRISGNVGTLNDNPLVAVTMFMIDSIGETMTVDQAVPSTDGSFHFTVKSGGIMQISGDYTITAQYGSQKSTTTFSFLAGGFTPTLTPFDTIPPLVLVPSDITIDATDSSGARVDYSVKAIDDNDGIIRPNCSPPSGSLFHIGETTVICSATDYSGNSDRKSFLITVKSPDVVIPSWIKDVAGFWCDDEIDDASFIEAIQYLINNDVIVVPATTSSGSGSQEIPNWVKSNACWWSQGLISNSDFASGLQYLIGEGIIRL